MYVIEKDERCFYVLRNELGTKIGSCVPYYNNTDEFGNINDSTWVVYLDSDALNRYYNSKNKAICALVEYCLNLDIDVSVNL